MKKKFEYLVVELKNGKYILTDASGKIRSDILVRDIMCQHCIDNNQCIQYDIETGRSYRKDISMYCDFQPKEEEVKASNKIEADPILDFIHNKAVDLRPKTLVMPDLKWKYLIRSAMRGKNIMMTGASGCGKTMAAKKLVEALDRPEFYFNLGATQDPRGTLIGNTHFNPSEGTTFSESLFVKAIQT